MKITLYTPDGTAETFRDCKIVRNGYEPTTLSFTGTDWTDRHVGLTTTLPYTIDVSDSAEEILASSPLTQ